MKKTVHIGIDVGSTTVKAVVINENDEVLWKKYERHNTRQARKTREFLIELSETFSDYNLKLFITGSGGRSIASHIHAQYVQEVNAVTYAVEKLCPDAGSVIELGGQDAKVIIWKEDTRGQKSTLTFMNDKCAGGTGATLDKIFTKIGLSQKEASAVSSKDKNVHHIAAKCGVFAETDVVGLLKSGINKEEIVVSLCTAIAKQNLEVLVRGNVLRDKVLLLGGPHTYLNCLPEIWRKHIPITWDLHGWEPRSRNLEELIFVPADSQYYAAMGAVYFGRESQNLSLSPQAENKTDTNYFEGVEALDHYIEEGRMAQMMSSGAVKDGLISSESEKESFIAQYKIPPFTPPTVEAGQRIPCWIGIDGGSTSSKMVLINRDSKVLYRDYVLSQGNPIADVRAMFQKMRTWEKEKAITLDIKGSAVTGYASEILKIAFSLDFSIVETVAHMKSSVAEYGDIDIICDVGGQDIKVLFMKHGRVVDFKLNTQCSAGNGYFLQAMAEQFNVPIEEYAEHAFAAKKAPAFNYGCAVFMEQDRVNFQQLGWANDEIMAGLALVLPLNIWNYVVQEPHIARFGKTFVLQGGTQKNLAAVKAQVDFIKGKVPDATVHVHKYADICGAIGAALEVKDTLCTPSSFIGLQKASQISFQSRNDEFTRCNFCNNHCNRTFVDITVEGTEPIRFISGYGCEKGASETLESMRAGEKQRKEKKSEIPNLVSFSAQRVFDDFDFIPLPEEGMPVADIHAQESALKRTKGPNTFSRSSHKAQDLRSEMIIGLPRLLNMYLYGPFFSTYFRTLGVKKIVWSDFTSQKIWEEGNKWGAIDPCFPAKVAPAHIWNLLTRKKVTHICFPMITHLESLVENTLGNNACVIQMGTPEVAEAVFTRDINLFESHNVEFWKPLLRMDRPIEAEGMLFEYFEEILGISSDENAWAIKQGYAAMELYLGELRRRGAQAINNLIEQDKIGILVLGHPYHHDPGLNHGILDEFQMKGYPIFCIESLPVDKEFLEPLFEDSSDRQQMEHEWDIKDVWMRNFNRNTNLKIWGAKVAARHPNLAVIDLSSFKCGHDAPTYSYIDNILDASETPHFLFHDIDQNKPYASIKIRIHTIDYFLKQEEEKLKKKIAVMA